MELARNLSCALPGWTISHVPCKVSKDSFCIEGLDNLGKLMLRCWGACWDLGGCMVLLSSCKTDCLIPHSQHLDMLLLLEAQSRQVDHCALRCWCLLSASSRNCSVNMMFNGGKHSPPRAGKAPYTGQCRAKFRMDPSGIQLRGLCHQIFPQHKLLMVQHPHLLSKTSRAAVTSL